MAEKLAFKQTGRDGSAIDANKSMVAARAQIVNRPGQQFLSRTCFPKNQNRGISRRYGLDLFQNPPDGFAVADDFLEIELGFQLIFKILLLFGQLVLEFGNVPERHGIAQGDGNLARDLREYVHVVIGKVSRPPAKHIQRSHHAFPADQRNPAAGLQRLMGKLGRHLERPLFARLSFEQQGLPSGIGPACR